MTAEIFENMTVAKQIAYSAWDQTAIPQSRLYTYQTGPTAAVEMEIVCAQIEEAQ